MAKTTMINGGICQRCGQRLQEKIKWRNDYRKLEARNAALLDSLKEAWTLGSVHELPTFGELNKWREAINQN